MTFSVGSNAKIMSSNPDLSFEIGITEFPTLTTESHPQSSGIAYENRRSSRVIFVFQRLKGISCSLQIFSKI